MFVVGSDEDDVETIDATPSSPSKNDIDSDPVHDPDADSRLGPTGSSSTTAATSTDQQELGSSTTATTSSTSRAA